MTRSKKPSLNTFGKNVRRIRMLRGLSQAALADKAGLDRTYISSIENGNRNTALNNILSIAEALGCLPGDLVNSHDE